MHASQAPGHVACLAINSDCRARHLAFRFLCTETGHLAPWAQAIVWAALKLNDALDLELGLSDIASLVTKSGSVDPPSKVAIKKWRDIMEDDPDWWPNKDSGGTRKARP